MSISPKVSLDKDQEPLLRLVDQRSESGIDHIVQDGQEASVYSIEESVGSGLAACDYDRDGRVDLIYAGGGTWDSAARGERGVPSKLYRATEDFRFQEVSHAARLDTSHQWSRAVAAGDYDGDGFSDLLITSWSGLHLLLNCGDGTFQQATSFARLESLPGGTSAAWADADGDGLLDLYVARYTQWSFSNNPSCITQAGVRDLCGPRDFEGRTDSLLINDGTGVLQEDRDRFPLQPHGRGLGVLAADLDGDRRIEWFVSNDEEPNFLYDFDPQKGLVETALRCGVALDDSGSPDGNMGIALGDFNQDGQFDLFVTHYETETQGLYRNTGRLRFAHASRMARLQAIGNEFVGWGTAFCDFDLDGDEDLVFVNGHVLRQTGMSPWKQRAMLLENRRSAFYPVVSEEAFPTTRASARGLVIADFNRDGRPDVATSHLQDQPMLLANRSLTKGQWLAIELVGTHSSRDPIGTSVHLKAGEYSCWRQLAGGGSYLSTHEKVLWLSVPDPAPTEGWLEVRWPSGTDQSVRIDRWNQRLLVVETAQQQEPSKPEKSK
ncbi:MAG: CRTAC1 family protein [Pirellulaceae bacterium]